jgi:hypothetical protein
MPDIAAIGGILSALKTAYDMSKSFLGVRDSVVSQGQIFELQRQILAAQESALSAQAAQTALLEEISGLKKQVAYLEAWDGEKEKYKLTKTAGGPLAYVLKEQAESPEPDHYLCANCFEDHQKSILQPETRHPGRSLVLVCHRCGSDIYVDGGRHPEHGRAARRPRGG